MATATLGLQRQGQVSFASGAFPGLEAIPDNGAEDIVNAVIADDGSLFRRGGSTYVGSITATDSRPFYNLWAGFLGSVGKVTLASRLQGTTVVSQLFSAMIGTASDFTGVFSGTPSLRPQRATAVGGMVIFVGPAPLSGAGVQVLAYGGATAADLPSQTVSLTEGSKTVNGSATSFTQLQPGMLMHRDISTGDRVGVVESIQSDTQLTLLAPWPNTNTIPVDFSSSVSLTTAESVLPPVSGLQAFTASIFDRVLYARGNRVSFTPGGDLFAVVSVDDYHELPYGASVVGMEPLHDQLMVFTTAGVFAIGGLAFDLTDAFGNVQHRVEHVAPNVTLWDNRGIAGWHGGIVAPCTDDVYLFASAGSMKAIGGGIRGLYRSYIHAGYQSGNAVVFNGRYILPVVQGDAQIDTLVCDLQTGAWTRWDGTGVQVSALASVVGDDTRQPRVFALGARTGTRRVHELSSVLDESGSGTDADGSSFNVQVTTRTFSAPGVLAQLWRRFRARFETDQFVSANLEVASGRPGSSFENVNGQSVTTVAGEQVWSWPFHKRSRAVRFRLTVTSSTREVLRAFEVFSRPGGK